MEGADPGGCFLEGRLGIVDESQTRAALQILEDQPCLPRRPFGPGSIQLGRWERKALQKLFVYPSFVERLDLALAHGLDIPGHVLAEELEGPAARDAARDHFAREGAGMGVGLAVHQGDALRIAAGQDPRQCVLHRAGSGHAGACSEFAHGVSLHASLGAPGRMEERLLGRARVP
jgi:hypothetical protein